MLQTALESDTTEYKAMRQPNNQPAATEPLNLETASDTITQTIESIVRDFLNHLPLIAAGTGVLLVTLVIAMASRRVTARVLRGSKLRWSLKQLFERFVTIGVWALGLLLAAMVMFPGLTPTRALTALGIGSVAIGLAFKDIFENFFAGVLILWRFPFENGDYITVTGITGRVVGVTVRNTLLRTVSDELVVIPNADIYKNPVDVLTSRPERRIDITCGIAYGEQVDQARGVIEEAVRSCDTVSGSKEPQVFAMAFGASSIDFEVAWWTGSTPLEQRVSRDEVVAAIKAALDNAGIEIPFPYRTLTFKGAIPVERAGEEQDR